MGEVSRETGMPTLSRWGSPKNYSDDIDPTLCRPCPGLISVVPDGTSTPARNRRRAATPEFDAAPPPFCVSVHCARLRADVFNSQTARESSSAKASRANKPRLAPTRRSDGGARRLDAFADEHGWYPLFSVSADFKVVSS